MQLGATGCKYCCLMAQWMVIKCKNDSPLTIASPTLFNNPDLPLRYSHGRQQLGCLIITTREVLMEWTAQPSFVVYWIL